MAMLVGGGAMEGVSLADAVAVAVAVAAPAGCLAVDWLKRRMKDSLRVGRVGESVGTPVNVCMLLGPVLAGTVLLKVPGAGKSLRVGS
jgi:hypothetical protein